MSKNVISTSEIEDNYFNIGASEAQSLANAAKNHIENYTNTNVFFEQETEYDKGGSHKIIVDKHPIKEGSVTITDQRSDTELDASTYFVKNSRGIIEKERSFQRREITEQWEIVYQAGLAESQSELDDAIKQAAYIIVDNLEGDDNTLLEYSAGDHSWRRETDPLQDAKSLLDPYVVRSV